MPCLVEGKGAPDGGELYYLDFAQDGFHLGGSSFAQTLDKIGNETPSVQDAAYFKTAFNTLQEFIKKGSITAGHDIGSGGLITTLLEMCFPSTAVGMEIDFAALAEKDLIKILFSEKVGVVLQSKEDLVAGFAKVGINITPIGTVNSRSELSIGELQLSLPAMRQHWMATSTKLEAQQTAARLAAVRGDNVVKQPLKFSFPSSFTGEKPAQKKQTIKAAVIREKGSNSEREMAYMMDLSGFEVRDVHMGQ